MPLLLCIDASVFVAACCRHEPGHATSRALLAALRDHDVPLIEPAILPVEVAAALGRTGSNPAMAQEFAEAILALPHLTLVLVDEHLVRRAIAMAIQHKLRGADALYATVSTHYGAHLITLDTEQLKRAPAGVAACKPDAGLALLSQTSLK